MSELRNLILAVILATIVLFGWNYFYETPKQREHQKKMASLEKMTQRERPASKRTEFESRDKIIETTPRVIINNPKIQGSISLVGARIDDITLKDYNSTVSKDSPLVDLFSPSGSDKAYFTEFGWVSAEKGVELPNHKTLWKASKTSLGANDKVTLTWTNKQNIKFIIELILDEDYMFSVKQSVKNNSNKKINFQNYALISRLISSDKKSAVFHEGPIGVFNKILKEVSYEDVRDDKKVSFYGNQAGSWFGFSDKYWLAAVVPDFSKSFDTNFSYNTLNNKYGRYQVDYLSSEQYLNPGEVSSNISYFFAGAKVLSLLDFYQNYLKLDFFDRAIDFGWFYFLTKPLFNALKYFYDLVGNFGISILIVTVIVKLLLLPLANKSFKSMNKMKKLQPEIERLKEVHGDNKLKLNQAMMELYRKEKVSPLSGCLPILIQIPIFFSLYKVIYISIEMRHAPFFGWIKDLSAPDPTTVFNLFGLVPWHPPSFLMIGVWPLIMAATMYLQQRMSPTPADPTQATVMKFLPLIFLFMFASFPAGLVIYWAWSNILSILQQYYIKRAS